MQHRQDVIFAEIAATGTDVQVAKSAIKTVIGTAAKGEGFLVRLPADLLRLIETFRTLGKAAPVLKERDVRIPERMAPVTRQLKALQGAFSDSGGRLEPCVLCGAGKVFVLKHPGCD